MNRPSLSQLKLTGVSPRVSPQRTRARAPTVRIEDREEVREIVPKLNGAKTGATEKQKMHMYRGRLWQSKQLIDRPH